jgi:hypothetical protein
MDLLLIFWTGRAGKNKVFIAEGVVLISMQDTLHLF